MNTDETKCVWKEDDDYDGAGVWYTSCDNAFVFDEGKPSDNNAKYCPFCGRVLEEMPYTPEDIDEDI